jgi:hypothetical protein
MDLADAARTRRGLAVLVAASSNGPGGHFIGSSEIVVT